MFLSFYIGVLLHSVPNSPSIYIALKILVSIVKRMNKMDDFLQAQISIKCFFAAKEHNR